MTDEEFRLRLAEYLAGEMSAEQADAFREVLHADRRRSRLAQDLEDVQARLRSGLPGLDEAERRTGVLAALSGSSQGAASRAPATRQRRFPVGSALRYAAVIALAFSAGYFARARLRPQPAPEPPVVVVGKSVPVRWIENYAQVVRTFPDVSDFGRALLAISQ